MYRPKSEGGLDIRRNEDVNISSITKLISIAIAFEQES